MKASESVFYIGSILILLKVCTGSEHSGSGDQLAPGYRSLCANNTNLLQPESENNTGSGESPCEMIDLDIDECDEGSAQCVNESTCVNTRGSYNCVCQEGYSGDGRQDGYGCTELSLCPDGYAQGGRLASFSSECVDINECDVNAECVSEAMCVNTIGSYDCNCPEGYIGDGRQDGDGCTDINECFNPNNCVIGTTCVNFNGSYACECPDGFIGDGRWPWIGQGCTDYDECNDTMITNCVVQATCINTAGSYYCRCLPGYTGDGRQDGDGCIDIDECESIYTTNCILGAVCTNTDGSYSCSCPNGYTGDGRWFSSGCNDVNECVNGMHNCKSSEVCFNTRGSFQCNHSQNVQDVGHLEFLNMFEDDGVELNRIERTSHYRVFDPIYVDGGIPIGTRIETAAYVNIDGRITFGGGWPYWYRYPTLFPLSSSSSYYRLGRTPSIIAPFWNRADIQREGSVLYKVYTGGINNKSDELLDRVSQFVSRKDERAANFSGSWMLVVDWNSVPPYPQYSYHSYFYNYYYSFYSSYYYYYYSFYYYYNYNYYRNYYSRLLDYYSKRNTFQAIVITDDTQTYTIFSYNCDLLEWTGYWSHAAVGYSVQAPDTSLDFDQFVNHPLSLRSTVRDIACLNVANGSPWSNLVYKVGESNSQQLRARCKKAYLNDIKRFPNINTIKDALLPCPCSIRQVWWDRRYRYFAYIYGERRVCYIQRFPSRHGASQLCCYSYEWNTFGALLGADNFTGSSMLRYHPRRHRYSYEEYDIAFRDICCVQADLCRLFYSRRPPDDCSTYRPPRWTWGRTDPHITTLDGRQYTFNGWGEYILILLNESDFMVQCRTRPSLNSTATQFSGFAFGLKDEGVVQIDSVDSEGMQLLYDGIDITQNVTDVNDTFSGDGVEIIRTDADSVLSAFSNGLAISISLSLLGMLNIVVNLPVEYNSLTQGLMGNFNGNSSDDFIFSNGTMLDDGASDSVIHSFGQSWQVSPEQSLFTYPEGLSANNFSHPDHVPAFLDEVLEGADPQIRQLCDNNAQCIFDVTQTGDESVGMATMQFEMNTTMSEMEATNSPPRIFGPTTFIITLESTSHYVFNVTDNSYFNVTLGEYFPENSSLTHDGDTFTFTWNLTTFDEDHNNMTLTFIAMDDQGAIAFLQPQLLICPCKNSGNCTTGGLLSITDNPLLMNCLCNPAWTGEFCEEDADGCILSPCAAEVTCTDIPAPDEGAICGPCPPGFSGDGQDCIDIDECLENNDNCEQICVNTDGNFTCECFPNYSLVNASHCEDIDECLTLNGGCQQQCTNTEGSHSCSCNEGYQLLADNITCEVRPEYICPNENSCDQMCALVNGRASCSCNSGYELAGDGTTCIDVDECETTVCEQLCNNVDGGYSCSCNSGYVLSEDGRSCNDVDECTEAALEQVQICPHSAYCMNILGSYECTCPGNTQLIEGACRLALSDPTTTTSATAVRPSIQPIPDELPTVYIIIISVIILTTVILFSLVVISMILKYTLCGKCCKKKIKSGKVAQSPVDEIELVPAHNESHDAAGDLWGVSDFTEEPAQESTSVTHDTMLSL